MRRIHPILSPRREAHSSKQVSVTSAGPPSGVAAQSLIF